MLRDSFNFGLEIQKCGVHLCHLLLKVTNSSCLLLRFVQQHRRKFVIAHSINPARRRIAHHELRIHFVHFFGDEPVLDGLLARGVCLLVAKLDRPQLL